MKALKKNYFNDADYINAGFLYINLEKWRNDIVEERFIEFLSDHQGEYFCANQGVLNKTFEGRIKVIEPKYNLIGPHQDFDFSYARKVKSPELEVYSKECIRDSSENPVFVHFARRNIEHVFKGENRYSAEFKRYATKAQRPDRA